MESASWPHHRDDRRRRRRWRGLGQAVIPATIADAGEQAAYRFFEFFTAEHPEPEHAAGLPPGRPRASSPGRRAGGSPLGAIRPPHVAAYVEELLAERPEPPLGEAGPRRVADALRLARGRPGRARQPAASVRGPKHVVKNGKTPVLVKDEMRDLIKSHRHEPRRRASRPGADRPDGLQLRPRRGRRRDAGRGLFPEGSKRWWVRLHEKGGKLHEMPAHHCLEEYLDAYIEAAGIADDKKGPLFRTARRQDEGAHREPDAHRRTPGRWSGGGRRPRASRPPSAATRSGRRASRTTWRTAGRWRRPSRWPPTSRPKTTKLYDRTSDTITLDEVERIAF